MTKCPKCGSGRIAPIIYGMPVFDEVMERGLRENKLYLGGCCIGPAAPEYHCFNCSKNVGSPPVLDGEDGCEDLRELVTSVSFENVGYLLGYKMLRIEKTADAITLAVDFLEVPHPMRREMTVEEWRELLDSLFCGLYLHEWQKRFTDPHVLDGEHWSLELALAGRRRLKYWGNNAFPPYWEELQALFEPFFAEAGIGV